MNLKWKTAEIIIGAGLWNGEYISYTIIGKVKEL